MGKPMGKKLNGQSLWEILAGNHRSYGKPPKPIGDKACRFSRFWGMIFYNWNFTHLFLFILDQ